MKVKTLTGPSIHAALIEARRILGDDVVLLESIPAEGENLAKITVMVDEAVPAAQPVEAAPVGQAVPANGYGYSRTAQTVRSTFEPPAYNPQRANYSAQNANFSYDDTQATHPAAMQNPAFIQPFLGDRQGRDQNLFVPAVQQGSQLPAKADQFKDLLESQLKLIHERLDELDRRFDGAIIGAGMRWVAHVLYSKLLRQGMRPSTVTRFFEGLVHRGFEPDHDPQKIRWALAQEIRNALQTSTPKRYSGTMMFIGPSGAGKTSLLLKLSKHPSFLGRHKSTVISILPENDERSAYQNPAPLFSKFGIPVQTVRDIEEMNVALDRAQAFEQVLIDTPPMPVHEAAARKMLLHVRRLTEPLLPMQVHLVLNATRALEEFNPEYIQRLPVRPDMIAFTHLDETQSLGRIAEWMLETKLPVQFASSSPEVPSGVGAFTPSWFVEEMMRIL